MLKISHHLEEFFSFLSSPERRRTRNIHRPPLCYLDLGKKKKKKKKINRFKLDNNSYQKVRETKLSQLPGGAFIKMGKNYFEEKTNVFSNRDQVHSSLSLHIYNFSVSTEQYLHRETCLFPPSIPVPRCCSVSSSQKPLLVSANENHGIVSRWN